MLSVSQRHTFPQKVKSVPAERGNPPVMIHGVRSTIDPKAIEGKLSAAELQVATIMLLEHSAPTIA